MKTPVSKLVFFVPFFVYSLFIGGFVMPDASNSSITSMG